ncbi:MULTISPECIES: hypothetical protein [Asticcacaulis]|uniref:hypothetical protein n=1 Tax=Asticcacaulis TaxID=76890 RepID=UPI001AEA46D0|nr:MULTISPECIES: hypothetical protein [Asticcacaulis]MBP2157647.1 hypothetical protein [Asticcacaulis solisilvae]MDR6798692.1 hypothetical protein [Asticcacaulis sp. BE141]
MTRMIEALNACISPVSAARVFNPMRSEYYLKDNNPDSTAGSQAVKVTLSAEAQAAMKAT